MGLYRGLLFFVCLCFATLAYGSPITRYSFDIEAQQVNQGIVEFALQRNLNIVFLAELTKNVVANEVKGEFTLQEALDVLLKNTGLTAKITNNHLIQIQREPIKTRNALVPKTRPSDTKVATDKPLDIVNTVEEIEVIGKLISPYNLGTTMSSTKTQRDFLDTPQIVNALTTDIANDLAARDYTDSVLLASSITYLERSTGVADELRLRGYAYPALKVNGIGAHAYVSPVDVAFIDSIEVVKGPSSVLFGRMEPGGVINMMLKQPTNHHSSISSRIGSDDFLRTQVDLSTSLNDRSSARVVGFHQQQGSTTNLDLNNAKGAMLALDYQFDTGSLFTFHYRFESQNVLRQFGSPIGGFTSQVQFFENEEGRIEVIAPRQEDVRSGLDIKRNSVNISLTEWMIDDWSASFHLQYDQFRSNSQVQYPIIEDFELDVDGEIISSRELRAALFDAPDFVELLLQGLETINIEEDSIAFEEEPYSYDTEFFSVESTIFHTQQLGEITVEQLYGANFNVSKPETLIWQSHDTRSTFIPVDQTQVLFNTEDASSDVEDKNAGLFLQWTLNWEAWTVFLGARLDRLSFRSNNLIAPSERRFTESTYRIGSVLALSETTSLFANYSEAFSPQFDIIEFEDSEDEDDALSVVNFVTPARSEQVEIGFKSTWFNNRLQSSCSIYQITKRGIDSIIEQQTNRGFECDLAGSIGDYWHITLGLGLIDATINRSAEEEFVGNTPRITPNRNVQLWLTRDISMNAPWQGRIGAGITYIDERFIASENETLLPAYSVFDIGATVFYNNTHISMLVRNLFDEDYTLGVFNELPFWTNPGPERSIEGRVTWRF